MTLRPRARKDGTLRTSYTTTVSYWMRGGQPRSSMTATGMRFKHAPEVLNTGRERGEVFKPAEPWTPCLTKYERTKQRSSMITTGAHCRPTTLPTRLRTRPWSPLRGLLGTGTRHAGPWKSRAPWTPYLGQFDADRWRNSTNRIGRRRRSLLAWNGWRRTQTLQPASRPRPRSLLARATSMASELGRAGRRPCCRLGHQCGGSNARRLAELPRAECRGRRSHGRHPARVAPSPPVERLVLVCSPGLAHGAVVGWAFSAK
mmetsp:Transcript_116835/g.342127  ORF Transcript_116835/g.342127 Transcript_116835/m.342127 type:complete len:259 (+) Transcript_116835:255-1031(+)